MTIRLSIISLAGMARTLVAVGTSSDADMFFTTAAAAPRSTCTSSPSPGAGRGGLRLGGRRLPVPVPWRARRPAGGGLGAAGAAPVPAARAAPAVAAGCRPVARCRRRIALRWSARGSSRPRIHASSDRPTRDLRGTCGTSPRPTIRSARMVNGDCSRQLLASIPSSGKRLCSDARHPYSHGAARLTRSGSTPPIKANPSAAIRHVSANGSSRAQLASGAGSRCSDDRPPRRRVAERHCGRCATIFLPISRLPTPPTTAPIPTGSSLPNSDRAALAACSA